MAQPGSIYAVTVDYGKSVEEMVKLGLYDWSNHDITSEHFPAKWTGQTDLAIELVHFNRYIGTNDALKELNRMGYRPAELHELLAFGEKYPDVQREFPVVALGSVWQRPYGYRYVPCLYWFGSKRRLYLRWSGRDWGDICRFAAVRK